MERDQHGRAGMGLAFIRCENPELVLAGSSARVLARPDRDLLPGYLEDALERHLQAGHEWPDLVLAHPNAYVNTGLNNSLDREWGLGGSVISHIGVSNNNTAVTAATVFLNGASGGAAANTIIKPISPAATRTLQTTTGGATFANADFTAGVFVINKLGLLNTATDAGTGLIDVIGGSGGAGVYARTFVLDLTGAGTFTAVLQVAVTAVAAAP